MNASDKEKLAVDVERNVADDGAGAQGPKRNMRRFGHSVSSLAPSVTRVLRSREQRQAPQPATH